MGFNELELAPHRQVQVGGNCDDWNNQEHFGHDTAGNHPRGQRSPDDLGETSPTGQSRQKPKPEQRQALTVKRPVEYDWYKVESGRECEGRKPQTKKATKIPPMNGRLRHTNCTGNIQ